MPFYQLLPHWASEFFHKGTKNFQGFVAAVVWFFWPQASVYDKALL
jgi:hypothetical protein